MPLPATPAEERWGEFTARCYALQAPDGGRFALTRIQALTQPRAAVVMLPGMFTNRHFWLSRKGAGLAGELARQGYDCWLVERRGLGSSPRPAGARAGLEEHLRYDLPLVQELVWSEIPRPAFWIGHSFGGIVTAYAAARSLKRERIAALVLFATQYETGKSQLRPPLSWLIALFGLTYGRVPGKASGLGPEDEPGAAYLDAARWVANAKRGGGLQLALQTLDLPVLGLCGAADRVDPADGCERFIGHMRSRDKTFQIAGTAQGFAEDYNHPGIVISNRARNDIWPRVRGWMDARDQR